MKKNLRPTPLYPKGKTIQTGVSPVMHFRGFRTCIALFRLVFGSLRLALLGQLSGEKLGARIADFCGSMGLLWIKVGQLLSMRPDIFPSAICNQLARLQDGVDSFPSKEAVTTIEWELGKSCSDLFSDFNTAPLAAASIGQIHRAKLKKNGKDVVIKVRRPNIHRIFEKDLVYVQTIFHVLNFFKIMPTMQWLDLLWELKHVFSEEIDFRYEASNCIRMRRRLAAHKIAVPFIYKELCTEAVIVMEYIPGVLMNQVTHAIVNEPERAKAWMQDNKVDPDKVGTRLLHSFLRQLFEDNLFHSDLHPGNLLVLKDSRLAFIDFGSIGTTEGDLLRKYFLYLEALAEGNYAKAVDLFLLILPELPAGNVTAVKEAMIRSLQDWGNRCRVPELSYHSKSAAAVTDEMTRIVGQFKINMPWNFFRLTRAWTTMDASMRYLTPHADLASMMRAYARARQKRRLKKLVVTMPQKLQHLQKLIDLPVEYAEMSIYRGAMVRRLAQVFEGTSSKVSRILAGGLRALGIFGCISWALAFFLSLHQHGLITQLPVFLTRASSALPNLDLQVWGLLGIVTIACLRHLFELSARFRQNEQMGPGLT